MNERRIERLRSGDKMNKGERQDDTQISTMKTLKK